MDAATLRSIQAPIKEKYKVNPESAVVTHHAEGKLGENVTCLVETHVGVVTAGLHPAAGGTGEHACSGDMLLQALAACAGVTMASVATVMEIHFRSATVRASGEIDYRGTLGVSRDVPVGFKNIQLEFILDTDAPQEKLQKLVELTERYCVVFQTLNHSPAISVSYLKP